MRILFIYILTSIFFTPLQGPSRPWKRAVTFAQDNPYPVIGALLGCYGVYRYKIRTLLRPPVAKASEGLQGQAPQQAPREHKDVPKKQTAIPHKVRAPFNLHHPRIVQLIKRCKAQLASKNPQVSCLSAQEFQKLVTDFIEIQTESMGNQELWMHNNPVTSDIEFQPFVQKMIIDGQSRLHIFGDLHGDLDGFMRILEKLLDDPHTILVFNGDYTDRGAYGVEVLALLWTLKITNPYRVFLGRGNHEDYEIINKYGFEAELTRKFPQDRDTLLPLILRSFNRIPVSINVGSAHANVVNFICCCHGATDVGYNPAPFLADHEKEFERIQKFTAGENVTACAGGAQQKYCLQAERDAVRTYFQDKDKLTTLRPYDMDHLWGDYQDQAHTSPSMRGAGCCYGKNLTEDFLKWINEYNGQAFRVIAVFRSHQALLPGLSENCGLYKLNWTVPVFTTHATNLPATHIRTPGPCFVELEPRGQNWILRHHWLDEGHIWHIKQGTIKQWRNDH